MVNFGKQFEYHKIPEWYDFYVDYESLKKLISEFKRLKAQGEVIKLNGLYTYIGNEVVYLDVVVKRPTGELEMQGVEYTIVAKPMNNSMLQNNFFDMEMGQNEAAETGRESNDPNI